MVAVWFIGQNGGALARRFSIASYGWAVVDNFIKIVDNFLSFCLQLSKNFVTHSASGVLFSCNAREI
jgi:hypothetical protein